MALDSALKRASAINVASPWRGILPLPDGAVGQPDRQVVGLHYSGITANAPSTEGSGGGGGVVVMRRRGSIRLT